MLSSHNLLSYSLTQRDRHARIRVIQGEHHTSHDRDTKKLLLSIECKAKAFGSEGKSEGDFVEKTFQFGS